MSDLLQGFQTGFGIFEEKLKNKFAMKRLEKEAELAAKAREDEQAHAIAMQEKGFEHDLDVQGNEFQNQLDVLGRTQKYQTSERKDTQEFRTSERKGAEKAARGESAKLRKHQLKMQQQSNKHDIKLKNLDFKNNKTLQTAQNKFRSAESKKDRDAARRDLITKIKAEAREGRLDRDSAKTLSRMSTQRTKMQIKGQKDMQRTGIKADKNAASIAHERTKDLMGKEQGYRLDLEIKRAQLENEALTPYEKTDRAYRKRSLEYGRLGALLQDESRPYGERMAAYSEMMAMHKHDQLVENATNTAAGKGDLDGLMRYQQWMTERELSGAHGPQPPPLNSGGSLSMGRRTRPAAPRFQPTLGMPSEYRRPASTGLDSLGGFPPINNNTDQTTPQTNLPTNPKVDNILKRSQEAAGDNVF